MRCSDTLNHSTLLGCLCLLWAMSAFAQDLHEAVSRGNADEVVRLIAGGADVNERDDLGGTPLHEAVSVSPDRGDFRPIEVAAALLRSGADAGIRDDRARTALHRAAAALNYEGVDLLLWTGAEPNLKDRWERTPLHGAVRTPAAAIALIGDIPNGIMPDVAAFDDRGRSPCSYVRDPAVFRVMREHLKDPVFSASPRSLDEEGRTPLHFAANEGMVRVMLEADRPLIEARDVYGYTPLHRLARHGSPSAIDALVTAGADMHAGDESGRTPIFHAAAHVGYSGIGSISHSSGAALHHSNRQAARSIIESLLEAGGRAWVSKTPPVKLRSIGPPDTVPWTRCERSWGRRVPT